MRVGMEYRIPFQVANREVDLAIDAPINLWFIQAGDYTSYGYMVDYYLATARPVRLPPLRNVLYPLEDVVWVSLAAAVVALAAAFALLAISAGESFQGIAGPFDNREYLLLLNILMLFF